MTKKTNIHYIPYIQNKKEINIIGDKESKRVIYFKKACDILNYNLNIISWEQIKNINFSNSIFTKIDTPTHTETNINQLNFVIENYINNLLYLENFKNINYINSPKSIYETLDKVKCKQILIENNIPVTPMLSYNIKDYNALIELLKDTKCSKVFIKHKFGSGAAGIVAYQYNFKTNQEIGYTSIKIDENNNLYNTKNIFKINNHNNLKNIIDNLCKQGVIIEKWVPKAIYNKTIFDLRVVYQFGKIEYIVARGSKSPITNLHLNNNSIPIENINLSKNIIEEIENICKKVVNCFKGLNLCGIDILLTPNNNIKVIEVNGQGDLIYNDIYNENKIYKNQIIKGCEMYE